MSAAEPMFTPGERERVRRALLARAENDVTVTGAALTGSRAAGEEDRWSDIDLVLAVRGDPGATACDWTSWLYARLGARHHWDLPVSPQVVRVLTDALEPALVRSLTEPELRRALTAVTAVAVGELERYDPALAVGLDRMLADLAPEPG